MPQTREHLDICALLGISRGVVALTKCDLVAGSAELRELAAADVAEALRGTFLEERAHRAVLGADRRGAGRARIGDRSRCCARCRGSDPEGLVRLPIDRVFSMKGFGTVVTGTLWAGRLRRRRRRGGAARRAPRGKVRGVQVHGAAVEEARAGQRTAVNLTRGQGGARARPGAGAPAASSRPATSSTCGCATWPPRSAPLKRRARLLFHAGTAQTLATVTLLDTRRAAAGRHGAGAAPPGRAVRAPARRSLHPARLRAAAAPRHHRSAAAWCCARWARALRRGSPELLQTLRDNERAPRPDDEARCCSRWRAPATAGITRAALQMRLGRPAARRRRRARPVGARALVRYDKERGAVIAAPALEALQRAALAAVDAFHAAQPLADGHAARGAARQGHRATPSCCTWCSSRSPPTARWSPSATPCACPRTIRRATRARRAGAAGRAGAGALGPRRALPPPRPAEAAVALGVDRASWRA